MEGDARGVGDVAEEDVIERSFRRLEYARQKRRAKRLALAVDVGVVRAGEIDALEGARAWTSIDVRTQFGHLDFAARRDDKHLSRRQLLHRLGRDVEGGLYRGALARDDDDVFVDVVEARPYAVRVARRERPAVASRAAERPSPSAFFNALAMASAR